MEKQATNYGEPFILSPKNFPTQNLTPPSSNAENLLDKSCTLVQNLSSSLSFEQASVQPSFLDEWDALECGFYEQFKSYQEFIPNGSSSFFSSNAEDCKDNPSSFYPKDVELSLLPFAFDEVCDEGTLFINEWDALECGHLNAFQAFHASKVLGSVLAKEENFLDMSFVEVPLEELFSEEALPISNLFFADASDASEISRVAREISPELPLNYSGASTASVKQGLLMEVDDSEDISSDELPAKEQRTEDEAAIIVRRAFSFVFKFGRRAKNFFKRTFSGILGQE